MSDLKYSVIIPTYNKGQYIVDAVRSAIEQTYKIGEIIVVDDGSTDDTQKFLFSFRDSIVYIYQENNERAAARNKGIRQASGDIIFFLDADDLWEKNHVEKVLEVFKKKEAPGLVYSGATLIDADGTELNLINKGSEFNGYVLKDVLKAGSVKFVNSSAAVFRKIFDAVGFFNEDKQLSGSEDFEMWIRIISKYPIAGTGSITVKYRSYSGNTMSNPERMEISMTRAIDSLFLNHLVYPDMTCFKNQCYARIYILTAINFYAAGNEISALRHLLRSLKRYPFAVFYPVFLCTFLKTALGKKNLQALRRWRQYKNRRFK